MKRRSWRAHVVGCAVALLACVACTSAVRAGELDTVFEDGNHAYADGHFADAVASYQRLVDQGVRDPALLFNLGDALYRLDRLAEARLAWERALRRAPADADLADNLKLVITRLGLEPLPSPSWPERVLDAALGMTTPNGWLIWTLLTWLAFHTALAASWVTTRARAARAVVVVIAAVAFAVAAPLAWLSQARLLRPEAVALSGALPVLAAPAAGATSLFTLPLGERVRVEGEQGEWMHVSLPNGWHGWVAVASVGRI